jgi:PBSX family phage terminase large subunit
MDKFFWAFFDLLPKPLNINNIINYIYYILNYGVLKMLDLPVGKQRYSILNSNARINIWSGAVRSGKSIASILRWIQYCLSGPNGNLLMIGKTQKTLEHNVLDVISELVGPKNYKYNRIVGEVFIYGRKCYTIGATDEKAAGKIQGITAAGAYVDEIGLLPESFWTMLLSRLSIKDAKIFGTVNPCGGRHYLKVKYIDRKELNLKLFHFTLDDNPFLDPSYIQELKKEYSGLWYSRFILGLWVNAEGAIYDQFSITKNVVNELPGKFDKIYVSIDMGTSNPTCYLAHGRFKNKWYVFKEYYYDSKKAGRQKTDAEYADDLVKFLDGKYPQKILVDPSASSFIATIRTLRKYRIGFADNEVISGIRLTAKSLANEDLYIYKDCVNLIDEMQNYVWDEKATAIGLDKPSKISDHCCDALRYGVNEFFNHTHSKMPVNLPR